MSLIANHPILSFFAAVSIYVFLRLFVFPRIKMYWLAHRLRRVAKRIDHPETREQLMRVAEEMDNATSNGEFDEIPKNDDSE